MMTNRVSEFLLERYKLGEVKPDDAATIERLLANDEELRTRLEMLETSDKELRLAQPFERLQLPARLKVKLPRRRVMALRTVGLVAAALVCVLLPVLYFGFWQNSPGSFARGLVQGGAAFTERSKGAVPGLGLFLYLKGDGEILQGERPTLSEGNTVQLAYIVPAGTRRYGVIFSIDGRAEVTMHYPYRKGQNTLLVSGRRTFLGRAFVLDDAPGHETFVMVTSPYPLDAGAVILEARRIPETTVDDALEKIMSAFAGFEVETITVLKK